jgi:hypothetical protein
MPRASRSSNSSIPTACKLTMRSSRSNRSPSSAKQLPKGWQYRTRALTEDLVLDLGPDKTIYAVGDEFHQYYTRIAETK